MSPRPKRDPEPYLPLSAPLFHVLLALADGDKHGYAILKEVRRRTADKVRLSAGTLYAIIKRLLDARMIVEISERPDPALDDERRRYYRLTEFGRDVAIAETERMNDAIKMARAKHLIGRTRPA